MTAVFLGQPGVGNLRGEQSFPQAARTALADPQLRHNLGHATATIRAKRLAAVALLHNEFVGYTSSPSSKQ